MKSRPILVSEQRFQSSYDDDDVERLDKLETIKILYGLSRNLCAFPGCAALMIIEDNIVSSTIAHIQGKRPDSPRYNSNMTDEERDSVQNLIVLCPNHHNLVDKDPKMYNTEFLMQMKTNHEKKHLGKDYDLPEDVLTIVRHLC